VTSSIEEILNFFDPLKREDFSDISYLEDRMSIGNNLLINYEGAKISANERFEVCLIFVEGEEAEKQKNSTVQQIREEIYALKKVAANLRIADLGNLKRGKNFTETLFALQESCALLFKNKINVIVVGLSQALTVGAFRAFKEFENDINLVTIDSRIDLSFDEKPLRESYLDLIIEKEKASLYNITCLGYQSYFADQKQLNRLNELYFDHYRLGKIRENPEEAEPILRDADLVSFDIGSVRMSDSPGSRNPSPNGFYGEEACQLARYSGLSDRLRLFGLFEAEENNDDKNRQTQKLSAQVIWYYLEGYINRKHDYPQVSLEEYIKYIVEIDEIGFPIVFYKSNKSNRWWIEIKNPHEREEEGNKIVVSCSESDYLRASNNEIPDKWWINFKKLR